MPKIRTTSIIVLSIALIFLAGSYIFVFAEQQKQHQLDLIRCEKKSVTRLMTDYVTSLEQRYILRLDSLIEKNNDLADAFARQDRTQLFNLSTRLYNLLHREDPWLAQMAFFLPDNTAFLRVHNPKQFGDNLSGIQPILSEIVRLKSPLTGFEVSQMGIYFYIGKPVFTDGRFIGTLLLGIQIEQLLTKIHKEMQCNSAVLLDEKEAKTIAVQNPKSFTLGDFVLFPGNDQFFGQHGQEIVPQADEQQLVSADGTTLVFPALVLRDVRDHPFGKILIGFDISNTVHMFRSTLIRVVVLTLILLAVCGAGLYLGFTSLLDRLFQLNRSLEEKNQALLQAGEELEHLVEERTSALATANESLQREVERREKSEAFLRVSVDEWRRTFDAINDPVLILDSNLSVTKANSAAGMLLSPGSEEEIVGKKCFELFAGIDHICAKCPAQESQISGKEQTQIIEHPFLGKIFQVSCVPVFKQDKPMGYVHISRDISHLRRLEQQLVQAQKMEAIATLAGGIAHDFNNILGAILGNAELLLFLFATGEKIDGQHLEELTSDEEIVEHVEAIKRAGIRAKDLVRQILAFSRQGASHRQQVVITPVIKEGVKLLRSSLPATIDIRSEVSPDIGPIEADPTQIHQVLMNLATNAAQAIGSKPGRITIRLQEKEMDRDECIKYHDLEPGKYIIIEVSDTGHGIPEQIRKRIFDPFFTTREVGEGTGMGLSVIHGIVVSHGGVIDVSSRQGEGATFTIFFPRSSGVAEGETDVVTNMPRGNETVLFVDDEEDIVKMRSKMLEYLGYTVFSAGSGDEALEIFKQQKDRIDLVITDQTMPRMTGLTLAAEIKKINSSIPIILCSGYSEAVTAEEAQKAGIRRFLAKPLDMRQLSVAIRELLPLGGVR